MQLDSIKDKQIMKDLEKVKNKVDQKLSLGDTYLNSSLEHIKAAKGKMLRPLLLLIGSSYSNQEVNNMKKDFIALAAAVETLHMATLIHDDIIDEAKMRRGRESVQSKYSKSYAVYMGDFLLSQSFLMLAELDVTRDVALRLAKAVNKICIGEMKQHKWRYNTSITPRHYLRIVSGKTATLFAVSLSSGALYGKVDKDVVTLLSRIGYEIGMAFQVVDDLLDYTGNEEQVGKELRADLIRGYYSLPVIFALNSDMGQEIREILENGIENKQDGDRLIRIIKESGAINKTKTLAMRYNKRAMTFVERLPEGEGKEVLKILIPELLQRVY